MTEFFDAEGYTRFNIPQRQATARTTARYFHVLNEAKTPARMLDVGCGDGSVTSQLLTCYPNFLHIDAIDVAPKMIETARQYHKHQRVAYFLHDLETAPLNYDQYDVATAFTVIHWVPDIDRFLANLQRSLKADGHFIGVTICRWPSYRQGIRDFVLGHEVYRKYASEFARNTELEADKKWMGTDPIANKAAFTEMLQDAGFTDIDCELGIKRTPLTPQELKALHCAAAYGRESIIEFLLSSGSNVEVNARDRNGSSPLFYAVAMGHIDCAKMLLDHNADPNWQDRKGRSPAHIGASKGQLNALKLLHQYGGSLCLESIRGDVPLHEAIQASAKDVVLYILDTAPATIDSASHSGRTAMHIAAASGNVDLVSMLLAREASANSLMFVNKKLVTPLDLALQKDHRPAIDFLRKSGCKHAFELPDEILSAADQALKQSTTRGRARKTITSADNYSQTEEMQLYSVAPVDSARPGIGGSERMPKKKKKTKAKRRGVDDLALIERPKEESEDTNFESSNTISTLKQTFSSDDSGVPNGRTSLPSLAENNKVLESSTKQQNGFRRDCPACQAKRLNGHSNGLVHNHKKSTTTKSQLKKHHHNKLSVDETLRGALAAEEDVRLREAYLRMVLANQDGNVDLPDMHFRHLTPARRYAEEKRIFQELAQLKRLQIQYGNVQESTLVRRMASDYLAGKGVSPGEFQFRTFQTWEKFLYDQLKNLYMGEAARISRSRPRSAGLFEEKLSHLPKVHNEDRVDQLMKIYGVAPLPLQYPSVSNTRGRSSNMSNRPPWQY